MILIMFNSLFILLSFIFKTLHHAQKKIYAQQILLG